MDTKGGTAIEWGCFAGAQAGQLSLELLLSSKSVEVIANEWMPPSIPRRQPQEGPMQKSKFECLGRTLPWEGSAATRVGARIEAAGEVWGKCMRGFASQSVPVHQGIRPPLHDSRTWGAPLWCPVPPARVQPDRD